MQRTPHSKAGLGSRQRHQQREAEARLDEVQGPKPVTSDTVDLQAWAAFKLAQLRAPLYGQCDYCLSTNRPTTRVPDSKGEPVSACARCAS